MNQLPVGCPKSSPWGPVDNAEKLAPGIFFVGTAGHGGIWLSLERQLQLPAWALKVTKGYAPKPMWWEEDCEAAVPLYVFQHEIGRPLSPERLLNAMGYEEAMAAAFKAQQALKVAA